MADPTAAARRQVDEHADPGGSPSGSIVIASWNTRALLGASLAANARRLVEQGYDWQVIGARFVELIESTVKARGRPGAG